jgi:hypothetical protein
MEDPKSDDHDTDEREPFQRFEDVLKKVVRVPKSEVDKARQKPQH